jgi:transposase
VRTVLATSRWTVNQRPTSARLAALLAEQGCTVSPRTLRRILKEEKRKKQEVFIPLHYPPGDLAEVDFFEVQVVLAGTPQKAWLFVLRSMASGHDFAWLFRWQDTACFLEGQIRAFHAFQAVPRRILYDNLKPAVQRLLGLGARQLSDRFQRFAAHFCFEPCFARPRQGHDKGGVEARGRGLRLQFLSPVPKALP